MEEIKRIDRDAVDIIGKVNEIIDYLNSKQAAKCFETSKIYQCSCGIGLTCKVHPVIEKKELSGYMTETPNVELSKCEHEWVAENNGDKVYGASVYHCKKCLAYKHHYDIPPMTALSMKPSDSSCEHEWSKKTSKMGYQFCIKDGCIAARFALSYSEGEKCQHYYDRSGLVAPVGICVKCSYSKHPKSNDLVPIDRMEIAFMVQDIISEAHSRKKGAEMRDLIDKYAKRFGKPNKLVELDRDELWEEIERTCSLRGITLSRGNNSIISDAIFTKFGNPKSRIMSVEEIKTILRNPPKKYDWNLFDEECSNISIAIHAAMKGNE